MCWLRFRRPSRMFVPIAVLVAACFLAGPGTLDAAPPAGRQDEKKETKLRELLKERLATLRALAEMMNQASRQGELSAEKVYRAAQMVHQAELDLCDNDKERIAVLEKIVKAAKDYEDRTAEHAKAQVVPQSAILKAKVGRLEAEIALERAKAGKGDK